MKQLLRKIYNDEASKIPLGIISAGAIIISIVGWYFTRDLFQSLDVLFWDEANYMQSGLKITEKFNHSWGPAYAIWYKLVSFFESDSIKLYYLNFRLMTILPAVALFVFLAVSNIRIWVSFSLGLFFVFANVNLPIWPKVSHYCIFVFLTGMILAKYIPSKLIKIAFISLFALNISYARPEFFLTYLSILGLWIIALFFKEFRNLKSIGISLGLIFFGIGIQFVMGNPLFNFQGDRSALAFAQHFMFNYFEWNNIDQDFWITWMSYYQDIFGDVTSIKAAYQINSHFFHLHFLTNFQNYFIQAFDLYSDAMLPEKIIQIPQVVRFIILSLGGIIMIVLATSSKYINVVSNGFKKNTLSIILLLLMIAPTFVSCFVIYPRTHYMVFHYFPLIFIIGILFFSKPIDSKPFDQYTLIFSGVILGLVLLLLPSTKEYDHFDLWRKENSQANLKTIEKIKSYNFTGPIRLLENEGGMNIFLGKNYSWVRGFMKDTTWTAYLEKEQVDIIYVTPSLIKYPTLRQDSTWSDFEAHPEKYGYEKIQTGNFTPYLLIHQHLLNKKP
ncbi:MAG TPA: hypothetical protein VLZ75_09200 [Chitinophagales bacterium]|nr:hypothetical protein [Chitinophagales bacterium]